MKLPLPLPLLFALSVLATGCATTNKLPEAEGKRVRINDTTETQQLLDQQNGVVLVGPKKDDKDVRDRFMREPFKLMTQQPSPDDFERMGAALVEKTVTVTFPYSSTRFAPDGSQQFHIMQLLALASRIEIRGRTSNETSTSESVWYATERAEAAKRYLLDRKMPGTEISVNVMGSGDHVADNRTKKGRALNQRVEIEFFFEGVAS